MEFEEGQQGLLGHMGDSDMAGQLGDGGLAAQMGHGDEPPPHAIMPGKCLWVFVCLFVCLFVDLLILSFYN